MVSLDLHVPSESTVELANAAVRALRGQREGGVKLVSRAAPDAPVTLPDEALDLLLRILAHLADGDAVSVVPVHAELSTQQAAELLLVSRPHVVKLVETGLLPCRRVGTHRRIPLRELLAYKQRDDAERLAIADELAADTQRLGLED